MSDHVHDFQTVYRRRGAGLAVPLHEACPCGLKRTLGPVTWSGRATHTRIARDVSMALSMHGFRATDFRLRRENGRIEVSITAEGNAPVPEVACCPLCHQEGAWHCCVGTDCPGGP